MRRTALAVLFVTAGLAAPAVVAVAQTYTSGRFELIIDGHSSTAITTTALITEVGVPKLDGGSKDPA